METAHSAEEDSTSLFPHCEVPINVFKHQIILSEGNDDCVYKEPHSGFHRYYISLNMFNKENLIESLKEKLHPSMINGLKIPEKYIQMLQEIFKECFANFKIRITQKLVQDINKEEDKFKIIQEEHKRAHRNSQENKEQILEKYYFPNMAKLIKKYTSNCDICNINKYDRHPNNPKLQETPIPTYPNRDTSY